MISCRPSHFSAFLLVWTIAPLVSAQYCDRYCGTLSCQNFQGEEFSQCVDAHVQCNCFFAAFGTVIIVILVVLLLCGIAGCGACCYFTHRRPRNIQPYGQVGLPMMQQTPMMNSVPSMNGYNVPGSTNFSSQEGDANPQSSSNSGPNAHGTTSGV